MPFTVSPERHPAARTAFSFRLQDAPTAQQDVGLCPRQDGFHETSPAWLPALSNLVSRPRRVEQVVSISVE